LTPATTHTCLRVLCQKKQLMLRYFFGFALLTLTWSCTPNAPATSAQGKEPYFFDIAGFFNAEIKTLNGGKIKAQKTVKYNAKADHLQNLSLDYEKELAVFVHSDINKLSWREKYAADTLREAGEIRSITYKALDEQLKTQKIAISFADQQVDRIAIRNHLKSIIASTWQELEYRPLKGYQVHGKQTMRLNGVSEMGIEVEFVQ